jgi:hypothetical protein
LPWAWRSPARPSLRRPVPRQPIDSSPCGGLGVQQVGDGGYGWSEWHAEARISRNWAAINRVEVFGSITNSAVSSTTGVFCYGTLGATVRLGL